jgi:adenosylcobinamide-phosphate synthase
VVLVVALVLDAALGELPTRVHPVVWMGSLLRGVEGRAPRSDPARFAYGSLFGLGLPLLWAGVGFVLSSIAPWWLQAVALNATFAGRSLDEAARRVERALAAGHLADARSQLRWLVSRPTHHLDSGLVAAAAIESLAENTVDSWVAPLLVYAVTGLGGAFAYRAANTADAMWGYHTLEYEWLGKTAARLDDVLNWLPARLGALVLLVCGNHPRAALGAWWTDAERTASPNAGQSMSVVAGHLGVRLEKRDQYVLCAAARPPSAYDVRAARRLVTRAMLLSAGVCVLLCRFISR